MTATDRYDDEANMLIRSSDDALWPSDTHTDSDPAAAVVFALQAIEARLHWLGHILTEHR